MSWTQAVIRLQDVDLQLADIHKRLSEVETQLADTSELRTARQAVDTCQVAADVARKTQQELEFQVGQVQIKRERTEHNLYSGRITNTRELQDLQNEIQSLKRRIGVLEDDLLEAMMTREEAADALKAAIANRDSIQRQTDLMQSALVAERDRLQAERETLTAETQSLRGQMPNSVADSYDYLRERIGNRPVAVLKGDVCSVCGMVVTMPIQQQVHRGLEAYCNNCRRLLAG
jgi:uncharacterized protein